MTKLTYDDKQWIVETMARFLEAIHSAGLQHEVKYVKDKIIQELRIQSNAELRMKDKRENWFK